MLHQEQPMADMKVLELLGVSRARKRADIMCLA
jgi:hypothetical protein